MRKIKVIGLVSLLCLCCTGCTSQNQKLKVALIVKSTTSQFFKSVQSGANAASKEYNIELNYMGPDNEEDYKTQVDMIYKAIKNDVDAIVLSSIDYNKLVDPVEEAIDAGIPVIIIDSDVNCDRVSSRITTDNTVAGKMAGEAIISQNEKPIVVGIVNFDANTANGQERENGFKSAIKDHPAIQSIYTINVQSNTESATRNTKQLLKEHPDINTLVTFNEWTTLGVGYAVKEESLMDEIFVVGFDNNPVSVGMLETGEVDSLIVQNPFVMGYLGVEQAQRIIHRKSLKEDITYTKTVLLNKENMFDKEIQKIVFPFH
ncbi:substrate-binding domain-containing protein [Amedibacillus sp. YH-ame10]